ncbi:hypothetical protein RhiirA4_517272 [Rhizophagus irregularis]|uniref:Uncharacterized protein n=1 Tax=Rhizophagus irregularis TaxID=588596 RepID=A0A2I1HMK1_9GLOM|nr:hypothetical protein RhiirA4_517272 [Rhizophagus irregularis]
MAFKLKCLNHILPCAEVLVAHYPSLYDPSQLPIKCPICKTVNDANSQLGHLVTTSITTWGKSLSLDKKKKHLRRAHRRRLNKDLARSRPRVHTSSNHHVILSHVTKRKYDHLNYDDPLSDVLKGRTLGFLLLQDYTRIPKKISDVSRTSKIVRKTPRREAFGMKDDQDKKLFGQYKYNRQKVKTRSTNNGKANKEY